MNTDKPIEAGDRGLAAARPSEGAVECRFPAMELAGAIAPGELMVFPGGVHRITASKGAEAITIEVSVDRETARTMQLALEAHQAASKQRPYFDFNHSHSEAAAWPLEFRWKDAPEPGVYARVEWSRGGKEAVEGKAYRAFSPTFFEDHGSPARVIGAPLNMGGLVNEPAFKKILPLWAKEGKQTTEAQRHRDTHNKTMNEQELAQLKAKLDELQRENAELKAKQASSETDAAIEARNEEIKQLKQTVEKLTGEINAKRKAEADAAVKAAVARGALPAKDEAVQAKWRGLLEADPSNLVMLAALPGTNPGQAITAASGVVITREDSVNVIKGYIQAGAFTWSPDQSRMNEAMRNAKERGAIYASEIAPRLERGESLPIRAACQLIAGSDPIQAANALGTLEGALVLQRALALLRYELPMLGRISTNLSGEPVRWNQTVYVQKITPPPVSTYNTTTGYADSDITVTDVPVVINTHKAVQVFVNVQDLAATSRNLLDEQAGPMAYSLALDLTDALYALITNANYGAARVQAQNGFVRNTVILLSVDLTKAKVPKFGRTLVTNSDYYGELAKDATVVAIQNNPDAGKTVTTGKLPDLHGFALIDAANLPGNSENLVGAAFTPAAFALATRVPDDYTKTFPGATAGAQVQVVTDPDTGLSLMLVQFIDHNLARAKSRAAWMYGVAKGDVTQLKRLTSA